LGGLSDRGHRVFARENSRVFFPQPISKNTIFFYPCLLSPGRGPTFRQGAAAGRERSGSPRV
jgi:hypothetical protein